MDRCRVWESHADSDNQRVGRPGAERALSIYMVDDVGGGRDDRIVAAVTTSPTAPDQLESLLRRLLPTSVVPPPPPKLVPGNSCYNGYWEGPRYRSLPHQSRLESRRLKLCCRICFPRVQPRILGHSRATVLCFSCGKPGHGVTRCPVLDVSFPFMLPGWKAEKVGADML